ncbi:MAG: BON domain-containing protein [Acidobacteria bacterium]|nr:BON domain-containing protein [Acidobacteriota bacterium]
MLRTVFRTVLLIIIVVAIAAFFIGYRRADRGRPEPDATGTSGRAIDIDAARDAGAAIGEQVAAGADRAQRLAASAALTAKIKSKMALDDAIEAARIDVDTTDGVVTLTGTVRSHAERERALRLARETDA